MNHAIAPGSIPPPPGLEKEEPELSDEDDIPSDDAGAGDLPEVAAANERPARDVERE